MLCTLIYERPEPVCEIILTGYIETRSDSNQLVRVALLWAP